MLFPTTAIGKHLKELQSHLQRENPILLDVVRSFRMLDRVAYRMGFLERSDSFATQVPWWPMISVLGTFSSGKSTFINHYLGEKLQQTGNQAVDDKFTVVCFSNDGTRRVLPGRALDADARFPFFQISREIEEVMTGEGARIESYLQLKTCPSEKLRGKIIIDSPGFDADEQRNATLRITDHIIDLSDLVLVFFDARHPEPGAMRDTLEHLVSNTVKRADSSKFLYVLNQIDNAARENNSEEVFAAWQRALSQKGLVTGGFYMLYNPDAAITIDDPALRERFVAKRDASMAAIEQRLAQVEVERAYRITGVLEQTAKQLRERLIPELKQARRHWRKRTLALDLLVFGLLVAVLAYAGIANGWQMSVPPAWLEGVMATSWGLGALLTALVGVILAIHFGLRTLAARSVSARIARDSTLGETRPWLLRALRKNTRPWNSVLRSEPVGMGRGVRKKLERVLADADRYIQMLNNRFADPSGGTTEREPGLAQAYGQPDTATGDQQDAESPHSAKTKEVIKAVSAVRPSQ